MKQTRRIYCPGILLVLYQMVCTFAIFKFAAVAAPMADYFKKIYNHTLLLLGERNAICYAILQINVNIEF